MRQDSLSQFRCYNIDRTVGLTRLLTGCLYSLLSLLWTGDAGLPLLMVIGYSSLWWFFHRTNQAKPTRISYTFLFLDLFLFAWLSLNDPHNFTTQFGVLYILGLILYLFRFGKSLALIWLAGSIAEIILVSLYLMSRDCLFHMALIPVLLVSNLFMGKVLSDEERLRNQLQNLSETDQLTGLANFRSLKAKLELFACNQADEITPLSLIMIDIDNFKNYNDTYGHEQGNRLLNELGSFLLRFFGGDVFIARYGGEEFIILLPGKDQTGAKQKADQLVSGIAGNPFAGGPVTVSAGVASVTGGHSEDVMKLIEKADAALYTAKRSGKNRAVLHI